MAKNRRRYLTNIEFNGMARKHIALLATHLERAAINQINAY